METELSIELSDGHAAYGLLRGCLGDPLVVLVHGLSGDMNEHLHYNAARRFEQDGYSCFRFNLYGDEADARKLIDCTTSIHAADLDAVIDYLRHNGAKGPVGIVGHSLGGLTALLSQSSVDAIALWDSSHTSYFSPLSETEPLADGRAVVWHHNQKMDILLGRPMLDEIRTLDSDDLARGRQTPTLVISASSANRPQVATAYLDAFAGPKRLVVVPESDHVFTRDHNFEALYNATAEWFAQYLHQGHVEDEDLAAPTAPTQCLHTEVRPWGTYWVIDEGELPGGNKFQLKRLAISPGNGASHHVHKLQTGHWTILSGTATVLLDGVRSTMEAGESVDIPPEMTHRIQNLTDAPVVFTELLTGSYIGEDDIERLEDN